MRSLWSQFALRSITKWERRAPMQQRLFAVTSNRPRKLFTQAEDEQIARRRREGATWVIIAAELNRNEDAVRERFSTHLAQPTELSVTRSMFSVPRSWTEADQALLVARTNAGVPVADMAKELGRSYKAVTGRLSFERTKPNSRLEPGTLRVNRPFTPVEDEELLSLRAQGHLYREIALKMSRDQHVLCARYQNIRRASTSHRKHTWSEEESKILQTLRNSGATWDQISAKLSRTSRTCQAKYYYDTKMRGFRLTNYGDWLQDEDAKLIRLRDESRLTWVKLAAQMPGKSAHSCSRRYRFLLRTVLSEQPTS